MCGYTCTKNALTTLNILYILVSFVLMGVAGYSRAVSIVSDLTIVGGIIACGAFLFLLALLGLVGAAKHHQVLLFFYMVILFVLFVVQFSIACACLAVGTSEQQEIAATGWRRSPEEIRQKAQHFFHCCGFGNITEQSAVTCQDQSCCTPDDQCTCDDCKEKIESAVRNGLQICGSIGLFFSFTEVSFLSLNNH